MPPIEDEEQVDFWTYEYDRENNVNPIEDEE